MDYQKHYSILIERAKHRLLESYTEKHHIIPRCMNGSDDKDNLVVLTPEEHYVAHQLLVKIYPNNFKLVFAAHKMTSKSIRRNNKLYGWLRKKHSKCMSDLMKGRIPWNKGKTYRELYGFEKAERLKKEHSNKLKGRKHLEKSKAKMKGRIPWNKGLPSKMKGVPRNEETKRKISESNKGKQHSEEHKRKISNSLRGNIPWNKGFRETKEKK